MHHWWRLANDKEGGVFDLSQEELKIRDTYLADREGFAESGRSIFTARTIDPARPIVGPTEPAKPTKKGPSSMVTATWRSGTKTCSGTLQTC